MSWIISQKLMESYRDPSLCRRWWRHSRTTARTQNCLRSRIWAIRTSRACCTTKRWKPPAFPDFGMMCEPLTESLGVELLTWWLAAFPCQDISAAGKGAGISGERSGLWSEMARIIGEVRPRYAFIENSPMLVPWTWQESGGPCRDGVWCGMVLSSASVELGMRETDWILATNREYDGFGRGEQFTQSNKKKGCCCQPLWNKIHVML